MYFADSPIVKESLEDENVSMIQYERQNVQTRILTNNGSYVLPNGVVVLSDLDMDAYLSGNLSITGE